jgi:hypothetical protein
MHEQANAWENRQDKRAIFLRCYAMMTANMLRALENQRFEDQDWVGRLLHRFADYYFSALACFDCGEDVPPVWRDVHETTAAKDLHVLQCLLLGVNAHINYDLVLTLHELLAPEWAQLAEADRLRRYRDHRRVNTIIAETIDSVQDEVVEQYSPFMRIVDVAFGRLDEHLLVNLITRWREKVWEHAQLLLDAEDEKRRELHRREVEAEVLRTARWLRMGLPLG